MWPRGVLEFLEFNVSVTPAGLDQSHEMNQIL
jgi:hypothetical protein